MRFLYLNYNLKLINNHYQQNYLCYNLFSVHDGSSFENEMKIYVKENPEDRQFLKNGFISYSVILNINNPNQNVYAQFGNSTNNLLFPRLYPRTHRRSDIFRDEIETSVIRDNFFGHLYKKSEDADDDVVISYIGLYPSDAIFTNSEYLLFDNGAIFYMDPDTGPTGDNIVLTKIIREEGHGAINYSGGLQGRLAGSEDWKAGFNIIIPGHSNYNPSDVDCIGGYGPCDANCNKTYSVFIPQSGNGESCVAEDGSTGSCDPSAPQRQGECPRSCSIDPLDNAGYGDCPSELPHNSSCTPSCDDGHIGWWESNGGITCNDGLNYGNTIRDVYCVPDPTLSATSNQDCVIGYTVCGGSYTMPDGSIIDLSENGQNEPCKKITTIVTPQSGNGAQCMDSDGNQVNEGDLVDCNQGEGLCPWSQCQINIPPNNNLLMGTCNENMNHGESCSFVCNSDYVIPSGQTLEMNCHESNIYNGAILDSNITYPSCVQSCMTHTCENGWSINQSMQNQPCLEGVCTNEYCCTEAQPISQNILSISNRIDRNTYTSNLQTSDFELITDRIQVENEAGDTLVDPVTGFRTYKFYIKKVNDSSIDKPTNLYAMAGSGITNRPMVLPPCYQVAAPFGVDIGGTNPAFWSVANNEQLGYAQYDSYITVGEENGNTSSDLASIGINFNDWTPTNGITVEDGATFWMVPDNGPQFSSQGSNGIILAQLTIPEALFDDPNNPPQFKGVLQGRTTGEKDCSMTFEFNIQ